MAGMRIYEVFQGVRVANVDFSAQLVGRRHLTAKEQNNFARHVRKSDFAGIGA
jgi:hypothetical protein